MNIVRITDLVKGDEVYGFMRLGLAIEKAVRGDGTPYGRVPFRTQKAGPADLTRWQGTVVANNVSTKVLTCNITATSSDYTPVNKESLIVDIHYSSLRRLRLLSKFSYEARQDNNTFPANFVDAAFKPYRTLTEVLLPKGY